MAAPHDASLRTLVTLPEVPRTLAASLLGRLPYTAIELLLILRVRDAGGDYGDGGIVAGAFAVGLAVLSPFIGRLVDLRGHRAVLVPAAIGALGAARGDRARPRRHAGPGARGAGGARRDAAPAGERRDARALARPRAARAPPRHLRARVGRRRDDVHRGPAAAGRGRGGRDLARRRAAGLRGGAHHRHRLRSPRRRLAALAAERRRAHGRRRPGKPPAARPCSPPSRAWARRSAPSRSRSPRRPRSTATRPWWGRSWRRGRRGAWSAG